MVDITPLTLSATPLLATATYWPQQVVQMENGTGDYYPRPPHTYQTMPHFVRCPALHVNNITKRPQ